MKNKIFYVIFLVSTSLVSCSDDDNGSSLIARCSHPKFIMEISEAIPATISRVTEGEPFFHGIKTYYEVDAEKDLPELFERNGQKTIRIFPTENTDERQGSIIEITGPLNSCLTGDHGLLTNDYKVFYILGR